MRSKSEVIIANLLYKNREHIIYKYEKPLEVIEKSRKKTGQLICIAEENLS